MSFPQSAVRVIHPDFEGVIVPIGIRFDILPGTEEPCWILDAFDAILEAPVVLDVENIYDWSSVSKPDGKSNKKPQ